MVITLSAVSISAAFALAAYNFFAVQKLDEGTELMKKIAALIRSGANVFLKEEIKKLSKVAAVVFPIIWAFLYRSTAISFLIGLAMSLAPCLIGMKSATYSNVRVTNTAFLTGKLSKTLHVAIKGASVMGLCVHGCSILGYLIVYALFYEQLMSLSVVKNWIGLEFIPFSMNLTAYSFGCSFIAIFARIGGGIYTKAADMGADLVGKYEMDIPEDDPRNPGVIADNVGDNVNDNGGLGSDILESKVGALVGAVLGSLNLCVQVMHKLGLISIQEIQALYQYALGIEAIGLISCTLAIFIILHKELSNQDPQKDLNLMSTLSAGLIVIFTFVFTLANFKGYDTSLFGFHFGIISPWICILCGVMSGIILGRITEYYTSYAFTPTQMLAESAKEGAAILITKGNALGWRAALPSTSVLIVALVISYNVAGTFGVALAAVGMLSFAATTVTIDSYGPIADNAGGIAEMAHLPHEVRVITDTADAAGNTTAAIGKGFAIGSAAFATLSLIINYVTAYTPAGQAPVLNFVDPIVLSGGLLGACLPCYFSGMLGDYVAKTANIMVIEIRRQFNSIVGLREGKADPDYNKCIEIVSKSSLRSMNAPAILPIAFIVGGGLLLGPDFVGAILIGATLISIPLAIKYGISGGAWDNAKKYIEGGNIAGEGKGSPAHLASIIGDTVGDPEKDTQGPCLDIMIKIMSTVALITVPIYNIYNLYNWLQSFIPVLIG